MTDELTADIVLEGGGVKGIALVGAISTLEEAGYRFNRVAGTSAGAIVGSMVAAGTPAAELREIMASIDYRRFRDGDWLNRLGLPGHAVALLARQGIYRGAYLVEWLGEQLERRGVTDFESLRQPDPGSSLPMAQQHRLVVMASDISDGRLRRLPWDYPALGLSAGSARVVDAVRASMAIPFFYVPAKFKGPTRQRRWLVDGGMLSNFPVDVFDRTDGKPPRWPTLGIKLGARPDTVQGYTHDVRGTLTFAKALLGTMTGFYDRMHIDDEAVIDRTIFVDTLDVKATDFGIGPETQQALFRNGVQAATEFLEHWSWPGR
jgi:NTE family protein